MRRQKDELMVRERDSHHQSIKHGLTLWHGTLEHDHRSAGLRVAENREPCECLSTTVNRFLGVRIGMVDVLQTNCSSFDGEQG